ncbi:MAG: N-acetylmuramoyl-L-alanine amidase-like protein [Paenibacillaceae bacterium]|jgi:N-acetylmuramoyl-L-alanine amidase|nr:N-acetylmuramoyl-L-alanine amidase-like protein [Paenibacillaceae bacterium]
MNVLPFLVAGLISLQPWLTSTPSDEPSRRVVLPQVDVMIDAGHGGIDGGTSHGDLLEKRINLEIAKETYRQLSHKGLHPALNRNDDRAMSDDNRWLKIHSRHLRDLAQRKLMADELAPKMLVSLHVNWSRDSSQRGGLVLYQKNDQSKRLAAELQASLNHLYQVEEKPIYGKTYYILNRTRCPAVIVEMGYISNVTDRSWLTSSKKQKEIAAALSAAIEHYLLMGAQSALPSSGAPAKYMN